MKIKLWFLWSAILYLFGIGNVINVECSSVDNKYLGLYKKRSRIVLVKG